MDYYILWNLKRNVYGILLQCRPFYSEKYMSNKSVSKVSYNLSKDWKLDADGTIER